MGVGLLLALAAPYVPHIYNTEEAVRHLATNFLLVQAVLFPVHAFNHSTYFTLRAGGQTMVTFIFDSIFASLISFPLAYFISRYTVIPVIFMYMIVGSADLIKSAIGFSFLRTGKWARTIVV
jgi:Na+-driven multidrug efflux pump